MIKCMNLTMIIFGDKLEAMENQNKGEEASETKADLEEKVKIQQSKKQSEFLLSQIEAESDDFEATIKKLDSSWRFEGQQSYGLQVRLKRNN